MEKSVTEQSQIKKMPTARKKKIESLPKVKRDTVE